MCLGGPCDGRGGKRKRTIGGFDMMRHNHTDIESWCWSDGCVHFTAKNTVFRDFLISFGFWVFGCLSVCVVGFIPREGAE